MRKPRLVIGAATLAAAAIVLVGCSSSSAPAATSSSKGLVVNGETVADASLYKKAQKEGQLTFYTGGSQQSEEVATGAFTKLTGIKVNIVRLPPSQLTERIESEVGAHKLGADVIRTSGEDLTQGIDKAGAFAQAKLPSEMTAAVKDASRDGGKYYVSYDRVYSIAYNTQEVDASDAPSSWKDLTKPALSGKTGIVWVGAGGSTAALTRFQLDKLGQSWLESYAANNPKIYDTSDKLTDALSRGEISVGIIPVATAEGAVAEGAPVKVIAPKEGAVGYPFYIGIGSEAAHPAAAQVFMDWVMSKSGQSNAASQGDYPARTGSPAPTVQGKKLPAASTGWLSVPSTAETLDHLKSDAVLWDQVFHYNG